MDMSGHSAWRKSSFSVDENCVEVAWRKSSFSGGNEDCVEIAWPGADVSIRDSKNPDADPITIPASVFWQLHESLRRIER